MDATAAAYVICGSCGCGCGFHLEGGRDGPSGVVPSPGHPASFGRLCRRGWNSLQPLRDPARIRGPLTRGKAGLQPVSWETAIATVAGGLRDRSPQEVGLVLSPTSSNEALFLASKFARTTLRTPNIDFPGRHATAPIRVLSSRLGETLCTLEEFEGADLIVAIGLGDGSRSPQVVPVIWRAIRRGTPVIAIDGWRTDLFSEAAEALTPRPHTDYEWIEAVGSLLAPHFAGGRSPADAAGGADMRPESITAIASRIEKATRIAFVIDTTSHGRLQDGRSIQSFAALLVLLRGSKDWVGLLPIFERCNTLGALDMGAAPGAGTGKGPRIGSGPGLADMIESAERGDLKSMLLVGDLDSWGLIGSGRIQAALGRLEFLAVASSFPTWATDIAHVVLPRPIAGEVEGSYTSTEGRVQVTAPYAAPSSPQEWRIFADLARALGGEGSYGSIADVREEIARTIPEYAPLAAGESSFLRTFWEITPVPLDAAMEPVPALPVDTDHPYLLAVERTYLPFAKDSTLLHSPILRREMAILPAEPHVFIHPEDAKGAALREGHRAVLKSSRGQWSARVLLREDVPLHRVILPEIFHEDAAGVLGMRPRDALTGAPLYPAVPISLVAERR
jgi:predicted molibdopterin-dependent oxidoreductase YjgC